MNIDKNKIIQLAFEVDQKALRTSNPVLKNKLFNKTRHLLKKALSLDVKNSKTWRALARAELHRRRFKEALKLYKEGIKFAKAIEKHNFFNGIGSIYRYMADYNKESRNNYRRAIKFYKRAIKTAPPKIKGLYYSNLSATYAGLKDWINAIKVAKKALILLKQEEQQGINHSNQIKILELEIKLYQEYKKRTLL